MWRVLLLVGPNTAEFIWYKARMRDSAQVIDSTAQYTVSQSKKLYRNVRQARTIHNATVTLERWKEIGAYSEPAAGATQRGINTN